MASFDQAARWMKAGKRVRRTSLKETEYLYANSDGCICLSPAENETDEILRLGLFALTLDSVLADDWQMVDSQEPKP